MATIGGLLIEVQHSAFIASSTFEKFVSESPYMQHVATEELKEDAQKVLECILDFYNKLSDEYEVHQFELEEEVKYNEDDEVDKLID